MQVALDPTADSLHSAGPGRHNHAAQPLQGGEYDPSRQMLIGNRDSSAKPSFSHLMHGFCDRLIKQRHKRLALHVGLNQERRGFLLFAPQEQFCKPHR